jgi:5-methylcytosine-specific restriction endonuclease McrA
MNATGRRKGVYNQKKRQAVRSARMPQDQKVWSVLGRCGPIGQQFKATLAMVRAHFRTREESMHENYLFRLTCCLRKVLVMTLDM